ncbi:MAG: tRNA1(Val) (adenine(37)-N6)-methyltransferase [Alphaproteobacteria bacterium]
MTHFTMDDFLGGLIRLKQPATGYRVTSDAVVAAAAVRAQAGQTVLDVGCGGGVIGLCIGARVPRVRVTGVELQPELAELARENACFNHQDMEVITADISARIPALHGRLFHHVVTNPPFYTETPQRADRQVEIAYKQVVPLEQWIDFCLKHLRAKGTFTMIHRTQFVPQILSALQGRLGDIALIPLFSKPMRPPKRVIITGRTGSRAPFCLHSGFVLHREDNTRTEWAEKIMRHGASLFE